MGNLMSALNLSCIHSQVELRKGHFSFQALADINTVPSYTIHPYSLRDLTPMMLTVLHRDMTCYVTFDSESNQK